MIMAHIYMSIRKYMEWSYQKKKSDSYSTFFSSSKLLKGLLSSNHMSPHFSKQGPAPYTMLRSYPQKSKQGSVPSSTIQFQAFEEKLCLACLREGGANLIREKCNSCTLEEGEQFTIVVLGDYLWRCVSGVARISNTYIQWQMTSYFVHIYCHESKSALKYSDHNVCFSFTVGAQ